MVDLEQKRKQAEEEAHKVAQAVSIAQTLTSQQVASNEAFRKSVLSALKSA